MTTTELAAVGKRRARAAKALAQAEAELRALVLAGHAQGLPIAVMCRAAGVSRKTAHKWLKAAS